MDEETGLYYFGARYFDPRVSLWYGVNPFTENIPSHSAYNYVYNNPIKVIDQQGLYGEEGDATKDHETAIAKFGNDRVGDVYFNKDKNEFAFQIYGEGKDKYEHNTDAEKLKRFDLMQVYIIMSSLILIRIIQIIQDLIN